ncbi:PREDICTED: transcription factor bHLH118-like isoform X4 [Populus euphratica]|uniref:Transcription factor bHLH118-like isoform X4 n=1 Tax=Populus euphratica TaxID=75702 RepID=A0AAJ6T1J5_POPEU|nr:PREDICTED: transcription factor bHLH118-like isoform X4 [Populus euphratica]
MVAKTGGTIMQSRSSRSNISSTKTERKIVERNRRNQMKSLYSNLNSLLPNRNFKEAQPLPDQIDRAINYIKSLEEKLEKAREKKESLRSRKRSYTCTFDPISSAASKSPQLKIHEIGSALEIVLTSGLDNQFLFYEIISILHEEGVEVVSANFQALGDSLFHIVHAQMKGSADGFGAARVTERLNRFISGSTSEIELDSELWDFANHPETNWEF